MPGIRHELIIGASVEKVYSAITSKEGLAAWWTPDTIATPQVGSIGPALIAVHVVHHNTVRPLFASGVVDG